MVTAVGGAAPEPSPKRKVSLSLIVSAASVVFTLVVLGILIFARPSTPQKATPTLLKATETPVEFLYLDKPRTLSYLEEIQGGAVSSEEESLSATNTLEAKLKLEESVQAGSSRQEVAQMKRSITPTVASIFTELRGALNRGGEIDEIKHPAVYREIRNLDEGQFVLFKTEELRRPLYLDPYLAVRQDPTLSALFPMPARRSGRRRKVRADREASKLFARQVGGNPHMVFSLWPGKRNAVHYLLPLNIGSFNKEDSVLRNGGGSLTVLGKLTRVLPEPSEKHPGAKHPAYVDLATRETWRLPLHYAPALLVCRSDPHCPARRHRNAGHGSAAAARAGKARLAMESALAAQTEITDKGAVVVPVAIYK